MNYEKYWSYPISKGKPVNILCPYMYTFVVENRESLIIERHVFATYGHKYTDQTVIQHDYFGTDKVIDDLKKFQTYGFGIVELCEDNFTRDCETKEINGISV